VIAPFISFILLYGVFIQNVSTKREIHDFLGKCTKILLNLEIFVRFGGVVKLRLLEQKQLKDIDILHQVGLEFARKSKNSIKSLVCCSNLGHPTDGLSRNEVDANMEANHPVFG